MDIQRKAFEESNNVNPDWSFKFDEELQQYVAVDFEMTNQVDEFNEHWDTFRAGWDAKAQAVPENKIEFDGEYIKYPNSYAIHCQFDEDFDCHVFDVYQNEDCVKDGMTQLKQAHLFVFSMSEAQEPAND